MVWTRSEWLLSRYIPIFWSAQLQSFDDMTKGTADTEARNDDAVRRSESKHERPWDLRTRSRADRPKVEGSGRVKVGVRSLSVDDRPLRMPPPVEIAPGKLGGIPPIPLRSACSPIVTFTIRPTASQRIPRKACGIFLLGHIALSGKGYGPLKRVKDVDCRLHP